MKQKKSLFSVQILIYVFLVLFVLGIYLIESRTENSILSLLASSTPSPAPTVAPTAEPTPVVGTGEAEFLSRLESSNFRISIGSDNGTYYLRDLKRSGRMLLAVSKAGDRVTALTLDFPLPEERSEKTRYSSAYNTLVEEHYAREFEQASSALRRAVTLLCHLLGSETIPSNVQIRWFDGASDAMLNQKTYQNTDHGFAFHVAATQSAMGNSVLRISLSMD